MVQKIIKLQEKTSVYIYPTSPFNFDATMHKPSHFPSSDNIWEEGRYWIAMIWKGRHFGLKLENKGLIEQPKIRVNIYSQVPIGEDIKKELVSEIKWRFNLKSDISEFCKKFKNDKFLKKPLEKWKGMRPVAANSFYESLIIYIVLQNATVRRTAQMLESLFANFGRKIEFDNKILSSFWEPKRLDGVSEQDLRNLKLGYRAKFIKRLSSQFSAGQIDEFTMRNMSKDEVKNEALKLYGIGPASVEYLLFEDFYHYNAFDTVPPWEQKIYSRLLYDKKLVASEKILKDVQKRYGKWNKLAIHYIWEDIFWKRKNQQIDWLEKEIRL